MTPLEAARRLPFEEPSYQPEIGGAPVTYEFCRGDVERSGHAPDCPWLALPAIVKALEAAGRLAGTTSGREPAVIRWLNDDDDEDALAFCGGAPTVVRECEVHKPDCPWQALVAALKGEVVSA